MAEGPPQQHNQEAKKETAPQHTIDSTATSRQQPTRSREELYARALQRDQRIAQVEQEIEKLVGQFRQAANTLDSVFSPQTPSKNKEQKKRGIRGLISRGVEKVKGVIGKSKSTETQVENRN
jgi:hypothetical protein